MRWRRGAPTTPIAAIITKQEVALALLSEVRDQLADAGLHSRELMKKQTEALVMLEEVRAMVEQHGVEERLLREGKS